MIPLRMRVYSLHFCISYECVYVRDANGQGLATFPQDFPDTNGYLSHVQLVASQAARKYTKKPPSKRPNFKKLHIHHPFVPRWDIVTGQEHHGESIHQQRGLNGGDSSFYLELFCLIFV
mgnify:FL=1